MAVVPALPRREGAFAARLLPWLPPQQAVAVLGPVSRATLGAVRTSFEVTAAPGSDLRPILGDVPEFGTLRVPAAGCVLSGAIDKPFCKSLRLAPATGGRPQSRRAARAPQAVVELHHESLYGLVEFRCACLCLDGLLFRGTSPDSPRHPASASDAAPVHKHVEKGCNDDEEWCLMGGLPMRIRVDGAVVLCRSCNFEAELRLIPPRSEAGLAKPSRVERCVWSASPCQGLIVCGVRPEHNLQEESGEDPSWLDALSSAGLTALHSFAGDLGHDGAQRTLVPNGLRLCIIRDCQVQCVRQHALLLRWDVCVLLERCELHGKVLIEEGPLVELRKNPYLELFGEMLDPEFVGSMRNGALAHWLPAELPRRSSKQRNRPRRQTTAELEQKGVARSLSKRVSGTDGKLSRARSLRNRATSWAPAG